MAGKLDLYLEAEKRGLLPPEKKAVLDEARKRGLVPNGIELGGLPVDASPMDYAAQSAEAAQQPEPLDLTQDSEGMRAQLAALPMQHRRGALKQWQEDKVAKDKSSLSLSNNPVATGLREFTRGTVTGSFLDEADAALNSVTHSISGGKAGVPYEEALEYNRARNRADDKDSGWYGTGAKVAGGIATGGPIMKKLAKMAKSRLGKLGLFGVGGGAAGGIYGFGEGEGLEDRLNQAETGAKWGAGLSLALPIAGSGGAFALQKAADHSPALKARLPNFMSRGSPDDIADDYLAAKIKRSGETPHGIADDLAAGQDATRLNSNSYAELPETIADTSDTLRRLMGSVYRTGNEAGETVSDALTSRQRGVDNPYAERNQRGPWGARAEDGPQGQMERVEDSFDRAVGLKTEKRSARQTDADIEAKQKAEGDQLYEAARNNSDDFDLEPALTAHNLIMQQYKGADRGALQKALDLFVDPMDRFFAVNNVRRFDAAKKQLDDMIEGSKDKFGKATNMTRELTGFKNRLLDRVHAGGINEPYRKARSAWGSEAENREAVEMGKRALKDDSDVTVEMFNALTEGQQRLFRIGLRDGLRKLFDGKTPGDDVTRILSKRGTQKVLAAVIPRSKGRNDVFRDRPQRFGEILRREARMVQTRNKTLGNSETAGRLADDKEMGGDMLARVFASGRSVTNLTLEAVGSVLTKIGGMRGDVALALAKRLSESDPAAQRQILMNLQQRLGPSKYAQISKALGQSLGMGAIPIAAGGSGKPAIEPPRNPGPPRVTR